MHRQMTRLALAVAAMIASPALAEGYRCNLSLLSCTDGENACPPSDKGLDMRLVPSQGGWILQDDTEARVPQVIELDLNSGPTRHFLLIDTGPEWVETAEFADIVFVSIYENGQAFLSSHGNVFGPTFAFSASGTCEPN